MTVASSYIRFDAIKFFQPGTLLHLLLIDRVHICDPNLPGSLLDSLVHSVENFRENMRSEWMEEVEHCASRVIKFLRQPVMNFDR